MLELPHQSDTLVRLVGIFLLGGLGCCIRYALTQITCRFWTRREQLISQLGQQVNWRTKKLLKVVQYFTESTLLVNIIGCTLIGSASFIMSSLFGQLLDNYGLNQLILLVQVGLCGGISTLSTFAVEIAQLLSSSTNKSIMNNYRLAIWYIVLTILLPLLVGSVVYDITYSLFART